MNRKEEMEALADRLNDATSIEVKTYAPLRNEYGGEYLDEDEVKLICAALRASAAPVACEPVANYESRDCYHIQACPHYVAVILRAQQAEQKLAALAPATEESK